MGKYVIDRSTPAVILDAKEKEQVVRDATIGTTPTRSTTLGTTSALIFVPQANQHAKTFNFHPTSSSGGIRMAESEQYAICQAYPAPTSREQNELWHIDIECQYDQDVEELVLTARPFYGRIGAQTAESGKTWKRVDAGSSGNNGVRINQFLPINHSDGTGFWFSDGSSERSAASRESSHWFSSRGVYLINRNSERDVTGQKFVYCFGVLFEVHDSTGVSSSTLNVRRARGSISAWRYDGKLLPYFEPQA